MTFYILEYIFCLTDLIEDFNNNRIPKDILKAEVKTNYLVKFIGISFDEDLIYTPIEIYKIFYQSKYPLLFHLFLTEGSVTLSSCFLIIEFP